MKKKAKIKSKKSICPGCRKKKLLMFAPDPYANDVNNDDTKVWLCNKCRQDRADDI